MQPQLTNEELALRIKNGEKELMPQLWEQVQRLVVQRAISYIVIAKTNEDSGGLKANYEIGDLINEGFFAVIEAIKYFNEAKECKFTTILHYTLKNAFCRASGTKYKKVSPHKWRKVSEDPLIAADSLNRSAGEDEDSQLICFIPDEASKGEASVEGLVTESIYQQQLHDTLEACMELLTDTQQTAVRSRYYDGATLDQLAAQIGCSRERARQIEQAALKKMYNARFQTRLNEYLEERTNYYRKVGVEKFGTTWSSAVEEIVLSREKIKAEWLINHEEWRDRHEHIKKTVQDSTKESPC